MIEVFVEQFPLHDWMQNGSCPHPDCPALLFQAAKPAGHEQALIPFSMPSSEVLLDISLTVPLGQRSQCSSGTQVETPFTMT